MKNLNQNPTGSRAGQQKDRDQKHTHMPYAICHSNDTMKPCAEGAEKKFWATTEGGLSMVRLHCPLKGGGDLVSPPPPLKLSCEVKL